MNASSASATSAAARMDIEKAAQDARTMFFITCAPLTGKTGRGFCGRAAAGAAENHARAERAASSAGALVARRRQETASFPGIPVTTSPFSAPSAADPRRSEEHTSELQSHHDLVCRL